MADLERIEREAIADLDASRRFVGDRGIPEFAPDDVDLEGLEAWRQLSQESLRRDFASIVDATLIAQHFGKPTWIFTNLLNSQIIHDTEDMNSDDLANSLSTGGALDLTKLVKYAPNLIPHVIKREIGYAILQDPRKVLDKLEPMPEEAWGVIERNRALPDEYGGTFGGLFADASEVPSSLHRYTKEPATPQDSLQDRAFKAEIAKYPIRETMKHQLQVACDWFTSHVRILLTSCTQDETDSPEVHMDLQTMMGEIPALICQVGDTTDNEIFVLGGFAVNDPLQPVKFEAKDNPDNEETGFPTRKIFPEEDADHPAWRNWVRNEHVPSSVHEARRLADHHALTRSVITGADEYEERKDYPSIDNPKGKGDILTISGGGWPYRIDPENPLVDPLYTYTILKAFEGKSVGESEHLLASPWNEGSKAMQGCISVWLRLGDLAGFQPMSAFQLRQNSRYMAIMTLIEDNAKKLIKRRNNEHDDLPKIALQPRVHYALALRKLGLDQPDNPEVDMIDERKLIRMLYTVARTIGFLCNDLLSRGYHKDTGREDAANAIEKRFLDLFSRDPPDVIPRGGPADPEDYEQRIDSFRLGTQQTVRILPRADPNQRRWYTPYLEPTDEFAEVLKYAGAAIPSRVWVRLRDDLLFVA